MKGKPRTKQFSNKVNNSSHTSCVSILMRSFCFALLLNKTFDQRTKGCSYTHLLKKRSLPKKRLDSCRKRKFHSSGSGPPGAFSRSAPSDEGHFSLEFLNEMKCVKPQQKILINERVLRQRG